MSAFALYHEPGLGKTMTTIAVLGRLWQGYEVEQVDRALVVCPASVVGVWEAEFDKWAQFDYKVWRVQGTAKQRLSAIEDATGYDTATAELKVLVTNYEILGRNKEVLAAIQKFNPEVVVCDEVHRLKNAGSKQSKALQRLGSAAKHRIGLTGTPVANLALDLFGIYRFLDPSIFGTSFVSFRSKYAHVRQLPNGAPMVTGMKQDLMGELAEKAHSIAHRARKDECLDLPERLEADPIVVDLEPSARRAYDALVRDSIAAVDDSVVVADHVLSRLTMLQRLAGGFITTEDGQLKQVSKAKLNAARDYMSDLSVKAIIFARFTAEIDALHEMAKKLKLMPIRFDGSTVDRDAAIREFQLDDSSRVMIAQISAAKEGITLTAARETMYYSFTHSLNDYLQSRDRNYRAGTEHRVTERYIVARDTVDELMVKSRQEKKEIATLLTDDWKVLVQ